MCSLYIYIYDRFSLHLAKKYFALILLFLLPAPVKVNAQCATTLKLPKVNTLNEISFSKIDNDNGLSSNIIEFIFQDKEGFLWIGTSNGLNRYDGYDFQVFKEEYGRESYFNTTVFQSVCEDGEGRLWLGTYHSGINVFNKSDYTVKIINTSSTPSIHNDRVNTLFCDSKNRIWIGTNDGVCVYIPKKENIIKFVADSFNNEEIPLGSINSIFEDSNGRIIVGTHKKGIYVYNESKNNFRQNIVLIPGIDNSHINNVNSLGEDKHGNLWLGTWNGGLLKTRITSNDSLLIIKHYKHEEFNPVTSSRVNINHILFDDYDNLWIGSPSGLYIIKNIGNDNSDITKYVKGTSLNRLSNSDVNCIISDKSGVIWLGTWGGGINKVDLQSNKFISYNFNATDNNLKSTTVKSFFIHNKDLYLGIKNSGYGLYDLKNKEFTTIRKIKGNSNNPKINTPTIFYMSKDSILWIGSSYEGVFLYDLKTGIKKNFLSNRYNIYNTTYYINSIFEDDNNNIWVGSNLGLYRFSTPGGISNYIMEDFTPQQIKGTIAGSHIWNTYLDSKQYIWIGTLGDGLLMTTKPIHSDSAIQFEQFLVGSENSIGLKSNKIIVVFEDRDGNIWLGTKSEGIVLYSREQKHFTHFQGDKGLPGDEVLDITQDKTGNIWATTNRGLLRIRCKNGSIREIEKYNTDDGLNTNQFIKGSFYKCANGWIYIGGHEGFNVFHPDSIWRNVFVPPVTFSQVRINNTPVQKHFTHGDEIKVSHTENNISVSFSALSYSQPDKNQFAYRLVGLNKEWQYVSYRKREVNYSFLPAGRYTLKVKASNSSGIWNTNPIELKIHVMPAPFKTWWAFVLYSILAIIIVGVISYIQNKNTKIKQAYEIEKIERVKSDNIAQFKFNFFTNISHELLTPLSVISCITKDTSETKTIKKSYLPVLQNNVKRLMKLITQLLDFQKVETGNLRLLVSPNDFDFFIHQLKNAFKPLAEKQGITMHVNGHLKKDIFFDIDKLDKIISNLITNAFKYTSKPGEVFIEYGLSKIDNDIEELTFSITDTGKGIPDNEIANVFERFYQVKSVTGETFGVGLGLALVNNLIKVHKGTIKVENTGNKGARFEFIIPVSKESYREIELDMDPETRHLPFNDYLIADGSTIEEIQEQKIVKDTQLSYSILVVEDNNDLRKLMCNYFSEIYNVYDAPDGEKGFEIAVEKQPDLIISDIMMPNMNGYDLCKRIKNSIDTSHILIILLTAKVSEADRQASYVSGADSYIPKPVNLETLHTRIESLINQREATIENIKKGQIQVLHDVKLTSIDSRLFKEIKETVERNLGNADLSVKDLSSTLNMSNTTLYRKLTRITGMAPNEYIRYLRLQKAVELIKEGELTVKEIGFEVGFNDQSYFIQCFKKQFGITPKSFAENNFISNN